MTVLACLCIAAVSIAIVARRIPIAMYMRNALRDRRKNNDMSLRPDPDQRKPDNDRRKTV